MNHQEFKREILKDKKVREAYESLNLPFAIGSMIAETRISKGLTQKKLAELVKTKQPSIARLERGDKLPSLRFLEQIARALKVELIPPKFKYEKAPSYIPSTTSIMDKEVGRVSVEVRYVLIFVQDSSSQKFSPNIVEVQ